MSDPFVDAAKAAVENRPHRGMCYVCWEIERMTTERKDAMNAMLSSKISTRKIAEICLASGIDLRRDVIRNHRLGHPA